MLGLCNGAVLDTPEVIAARNQFFQAFNAAVRASNPSAPAQQAAPVHSSVWTGPVAATVPAGVNGALNQVPDTADVAAARQAFLAAYNAQLAATGARPTTHSAPVVQQAPAVLHGATKWTGPLAATVPAGLPGSSNVAHTAEVEAARQAFFNAFRAAGGVAGHHAPAAPVPVQAPAHRFGGQWTGPVAATISAGLPGSGPVQDTAEVAAARAAFFQAHQQAQVATGGHRRF